ncbi:MAG: lytic murein transglycosylase [Rhodospirillaceae bacterium]|nr:lytic murein transglycosylase [Rhodospirillaceae bacterium]
MTRTFRPTSRWAATAAFGVLLAGCQSAPPPMPAAAPPSAPPVAAVPLPDTKPSFDAWLADARTEALSKGIRPATVTAALTGIAPIPRVVELDGRQPEFTQTFSRYLANAVTPARINEGVAMMERHRTLLAALEKKYGVPGRFLVAFWGLETAYGKIPGDFPVVNALATLAYDGRRGAMFRAEMFTALTILDQGHITLDRMKGSWAGAMGNTQFMPSTFMKNAVDEDGDGRKDIWGDVPDALGSAANFLKNLGWDATRTWGREVSLPAGFDVSLASLDTDAKETIKPLREWARLGVTRAGGGALPAQDVDAALVLPGGVKGPAFLVYEDFRVIMKWNRSVSYALAVGHLADRISGGGPLVAAGQNDPPLKREDVLQLQTDLAALGFLKNTPDGVLGPVSKQAARSFQRANGLPPDGYVDAPLMAAVRAKAATPAVAGS